ncbi:neuronal acetylcholine receptor subunit alpha-3-like isoform X2 [Convolutriloba macropyga]|uniref:neuronal acetylcholine receptor subunit alpha-3-like isoform X2 n=1 Tax=Convolutriloba macropyga TaxID=536237 RepID=UPI003F51B957
MTYPQGHKGRNYQKKTCGVKSTEAERNLIAFLFENYTKEVRPVDKHNETLCLEFGIAISQLHEVKEKDQVMKTSLWLEQNWTDINLKWNPEEYDNITSIRVPSSWLWLPDIVLYNNADGQYEVTLRTKALVRYQGQVEWTPPAIYKSSCEIDVKFFPFDMQYCKMKFGSWTYDAKLVDLYLRRETVDKRGYSENGEWELVDAPGFKHVIVYSSCCGNTYYTDVTFQFVLIRKPLFYTVNLIIPCVLISFLTVLVFYLPSDCGEKVTLCISVLLALTVFLLLIAEIIPATSLVVPLIGNYLLFTMVMVTLSIIITVVVLNVHHRVPSTHTMPNWVKTVFLNYLPKLLLMKQPEKQDSNAPSGYTLFSPITPTSAQQSSANYSSANNVLSSGLANNVTNSHISQGGAYYGNGGLVNNTPNDFFGTAVHSGNFHPNNSSANQNSSFSPQASLAKRKNSKYQMRQDDFITEDDIQITTNTMSNSYSTGGHQRSNQGQGNTGSAGGNGTSAQTSVSLSNDIKRAIEGVQYIAQHLKNEDEFNSVSEDWKYVAMVVDRLFLWVFVIICVVGTCTIILDAPLIKDPDSAYTGIHDPEAQINACGQGFVN